jgi:hypothetical protein
MMPIVPLAPTCARRTIVIRRVSEVAAQARTGTRLGVLAHPALIDGNAGVLTTGRQPLTIVAFTVTDGAITAIRALADPDRLAQVVP